MPTRIPHTCTHIRNFQTVEPNLDLHLIILDILKIKEYKRKLYVLYIKLMYEARCMR